MLRKQDNNESFRGLGTTKSLRKICFDLMDKGVPKNKISDYCEHAGHLGLPGSLGHRYCQVVKTGIVLGVSVLGAFLGSKIDSSSFAPEVFGGLIGLTFGLYGFIAEEAEEMHTPLIQSLINNHPKELRDVYLANGFSEEEIKEVFGRNRYQEKFEILFSP